MSSGKADIESSEPRKKTNPRLVFALAALIGQKVVVTCLDGTSIEGILVGSGNDGGTSFDGISLRYAQQGKQLLREVNVPWGKISFVFAADSGNMIDQIRAEVCHSSRGEGFRTDTDISKEGHGIGARKLEAPNSSWLQGRNLSLEDEDIGDFDQFKTNEEKFGVKSTFDENLYTTSLDRSRLSHEQRRHAERLAREIETKKSSNVHVREERGQRVADEEDPFHGDEELRYSSVLRGGDDGKESTRYTPPHRRVKEAAESDSLERGAGAKPPSEAAASVEQTTRAGTSCEVASKPPEGPSKPADESSKPRKGLNPVAKEWKPNPGAKTFTPSAANQGEHGGGYYPPPVPEMAQMYVSYPAYPPAYAVPPMYAVPGGDPSQYYMPPQNQDRFQRGRGPNSSQPQ